MLSEYFLRGGCPSSIDPCREGTVAFFARGKPTEAACSASSTLVVVKRGFFTTYQIHNRNIIVIFVSQTSLKNEQSCEFLLSTLKGHLMLTLKKVIIQVM